MPERQKNGTHKPKEAYVVLKSSDEAEASRVMGKLSLIPNDIEVKLVDGKLVAVRKNKK